MDFCERSRVRIGEEVNLESLAGHHLLFMIAMLLNCQKCQVALVNLLVVVTAIDVAAAAAAAAAVVIAFVAFVVVLLLAQHPKPYNLFQASLPQLFNSFGSPPSALASLHKILTRISSLPNKKGTSLNTFVPTNTTMQIHLLRARTHASTHPLSIACVRARAHTHARLALCRDCRPCWQC
eukprot:1145802-Pelagomonas_calceolata.AAC.2